MVFKECGDIVLGNIGFLGNLCPFASSKPYFLGKLGHICIEESCFSAHLSHETHALNWELGPTILS
jgi:hypothetical protein